MVDGRADVIKLRPKLAVNNETRKDNSNGRPVNDEVVTMLRDALEMAETGEIVAAIITAVEKDGRVESMVAGAEECGYQLISGSLLGAQVVTDIVLGVDRDEFDDGGGSA